MAPNEQSINKVVLLRRQAAVMQMEEIQQLALRKRALQLAELNNKNQSLTSTASQPLAICSEGNLVIRSEETCVDQSKSNDTPQNDIGLDAMSIEQRQAYYRQKREIVNKQAVARSSRRRLLTVRAAQRDKERQEEAQ